MTTKDLEATVAALLDRTAGDLTPAALAGRVYRRTGQHLTLADLRNVTSASDQGARGVDGANDPGDHRLVTDGGFPGPEAGSAAPVLLLVGDEALSPRSLRVEEGAGADRLYARFGPLVDVQKGTPGQVIAPLGDDLHAAPVEVEGVETVEGDRTTVTLRPRRATRQPSRGDRR